MESKKWQKWSNLYKRNTIIDTENKLMFTKGGRGKLGIWD